MLLQLFYHPAAVTKHIILCQYSASWCIISTWHHASLPAPWHEGNENGYGREREREKKDRGNTEEMTTTQSAMLLLIVWVDFPTQQGHRG